MRIFKKRTLNERFHIPADAAKEKLQHSGFRISHSDAISLILDGPKENNPKRPLTIFHRISLSHHKDKLHLVALKRNPEDRWITSLFLPLLLSFAVILIASSIDASPGMSTAIIVAILLTTVALGNLTSSSPKLNSDPDLTLEKLLNQIMNQPNVVLQLRLNTLRALTTILHCPYCRDELLNLLPYSCTDCQTQIHQECWEELGRCPTFGCDNMDLKSLSSDEATGSADQGSPEPQLHRVLRLLKRPLF